jgi:biopolymer transport protein ExbD
MATETPEETEEYEKKARKKKPHDEFQGGLNINSLMDIMTILLVFLLVSITSDPLNIKQDDFLLLAKSTADYDPKDSITVTITKEQILVDDERAVKVDCTTPGGQICQPEDYKQPGNRYWIDKAFKEDGDEASFMVRDLFKKLEEHVKQLKEDAKQLGDKYKFEGILTIICDRDVPFRMIAEVVHTAGMAGLSDLRFAIIKTDAR